MEVRIKDLTLDVEFVVDSKKRGWSISFTRPNHVRFVSGKDMSNDEIELELLKHYRFFKRRMSIIEPHHSESVHFFGVEYEIIRVTSDVRRMLLSGGKLYLYTDTEDDAVNRDIVCRFYEENLYSYIQSHLEEAKSAFKITFPVTVSIKDVKTYYGECRIKEREIIFQSSLCKYDELYIRSVLYHELAHFFYRNHQDGFYNLLEKVFPGYRKVQADLRKTRYNDLY